MATEVKVSDDTPSCDYSHLSDEEIWREFRQGNEAAFVYIYNSNFQLLYQYGQQFTHDLNLVEDLIQDLLIEIRKNRNNLGKAPSIKFYLFKALRRKITRYNKKKKLVFVENIYSFKNICFEPPTEEQYIKNQIDEIKRVRLEKAFKEIAPRQREAVYYYFFQGLGYSDIAYIMGVSHTKSVRNLIYKALDTLQKQLDPHKDQLLLSLFF